jgi:hypothetical protein
MLSQSRKYKALLSVMLCCGLGQLSMAQQSAPAHPLIPLPPRLQLGSLQEVNLKAVRATGLVASQAPTGQMATPRPQPLFLLNSEVIIAPDFSGLQPADIKTLMVYKGQDAPAQWRELVTNGVIDVTPRQKIKLRSRTLVAVGKGLGLSGPVHYFVNAMPVKDGSLRIALEAIGEIKVMRATPETPAILAISVRPPKPSPPRQDPPGTIYLRGVAAN